MEKENKKDNTNLITGFYEDFQITSPEMSVTVHPNTTFGINPSSGAPIYSTDSSGEPYIDWKIPDSNLPEISHRKGWNNINWSAKYQKEPIIKFFFNEDFVASVNNEWTTFSGGNAIEGMFRQLKPMAPMLGGAARLFEKGQQEAGGADPVGGTIASMLSQGAQWAKNMALKSETFLQNALRVQGTQFAYYDGTDVGFSNLTFKHTFITGYVKEGDNKSPSYKFKTAIQQFQALSPYFIGEWRDFKASDLSVGNVNVQTESDAANKVINTVANAAGGAYNTGLEYLEGENLVAWQRPPAGYRMEKRQMGVCNRGTFRLCFGNMYTIENLVIKSVSATYSRQMCKFPTAEKDSGECTPLYVDVVFQFQPAGNFSSHNWVDFINYSGMDSLHQKYKEDVNANRKKANIRAQTNEIAESIGDNATNSINNAFAESLKSARVGL